MSKCLILGLDSVCLRGEHSTKQPSPLGEGHHVTHGKFTLYLRYHLF